MTHSSPIGVFDSGVGGLSVLKHLVHVLPSERYIYLGDTARVPYGNKSVETVQQYSVQCAQFLIERRVKLIVIACNSASSVALDMVRSISPVPVIGVIEPGSRAAAEATRNGILGVVGTRATIGSGAYARSIERQSTSAPRRILSQVCPLFVPLAEEGWTSHPVTHAVAREYMKPFVQAGVDTVVLGCTHYPLLIDTIHDAIPDATLIDPGRFVALDAHLLLHEAQALAPVAEIPVTEIDYFVTDIPATFSEVAKQFLGFDVPSPILVHIE